MNTVWSMYQKEKNLIEIYLISVEKLFIQSMHSMLKLIYPTTDPFSASQASGSIKQRYISHAISK